MRLSSSSSSRRPPPPTSQLQQIRQSSFMFGVQPAPPFRDEGGGERGGRKGEGGGGGKWGSIFLFFEASRRHALSQLGPYCAIFEAILKCLGPSWSPLGANASHPKSRTPCGCSADTNHNQCHHLQPRCRHERVPRHENARSTAHSRPTAQSRWPAWLPRLLR